MRIKNYRHRLFFEELGTLLTSHFLGFCSKNSKILHRDIQNALTVVGYPHIETELYASVMGSVRVFVKPNRTEPKKFLSEPNRKNPHPNRTEPNRKKFQKFYVMKT